MGSPRVQGVALLAGLLRAINKRCCQHPPLDPRLFSSSPPLSLCIYIRVCVYTCIYIFLSFLFAFFFFFLTFFILPSSSLPLSSRDLFFLAHAFSQESSSSLSFSLAVWNIRFNPPIRFPNRSFFSSPFFSLSGQSQGDYFPSIFVVLDFFLVFRLDRFHAFRVVSQIPPLRLSFLLYRIQGISLSIFPVDSSRNRLDFRSLPPRLSRIPPLATLSLSFVPPLGIFTSSLFVARYFIISFTFMQFMQLHTKLISFSIVKFLNSTMFFLDRFILLPHSSFINFLLLPFDSRGNIL